jgi:hypothetical protein
MHGTPSINVSGTLWTEADTVAYLVRYREWFYNDTNMAKFGKFVSVKQVYKTMDTAQRVCTLK